MIAGTSSAPLSSNTKPSGVFAPASSSSSLTSAAVAKDPASVLVLGSARLATEESWLLAQLFRGTAGAPQVEFHPDLGPERKIKNPAVPGGWLIGKEAAPNSRGAEAAGVTGTPTLFVNGTLVAEHSLDALSAAIDPLLRR